MPYFRIVKNNLNLGRTYYLKNRFYWTENCIDKEINIFPTRDSAVDTLAHILRNSTSTELETHSFEIEVSKSPKNIPVVWPPDDGYNDLTHD